MENRQLKFTIPELRMTMEQCLCSRELLYNWRDQCDDISADLAAGFPLSEPEDFFAVLALRGRFKRLTPSFCNKFGVQQAIKMLDAEYDKMTDEQIRAAVDLFETDYWKRAFQNQVDKWLDEQSDTEDFFNEVSDFAVDLDDFGSVLAMAAKRGICPADSSPRWNDFDQCKKLLIESDPVRVVLSRWIQSMAGLINEEIDEMDYDLAYTATLWSDWLSWLQTDEKVQYLHPDYVQWKLQRLASVIATIKENATAEAVPVLRTPLAIWEQFTGTTHIVMAASTKSSDGSPFVKLTSPDKKYYAFGEFEIERQGISFVLNDSSTDEPISDFASAKVCFSGITKSPNQEGVFYFTESELKQSAGNLSFGVQLQGQDTFIPWEKEEGAEEKEDTF